MLNIHKRTHAHACTHTHTHTPVYVGQSSRPSLQNIFEELYFFPFIFLCCGFKYAVSVSHLPLVLHLHAHAVDCGLNISH